ncbi:hypothetical protein CYMTET_28724, partial [Cymbomonas tetramitiformis]
YPVMLITTFNVADLAGKMLPVGELMAKEGGNLLLALAGLRLLFIPVFVACAFGPQAMRSEVVMTVLTFALGISSGWVATVAMVTGPTRVAVHEQESAGHLMVVCLVLGLTAGALSGWLWLLG